MALADTPAVRGAATRQAKQSNRVIVYACVGAVLTLAYPLLAASAWTTNAHFHVNIEVFSATLAAVVGLLAFTRFYSRKSNTFLFLGAGFVGTALLDACHAVVASPELSHLLPSGLARLIPWSWVASRLFLSVLLCMTWFFWQLEASRGTGGQLKEQRIFALVGLLTVACFLLFTFVPLPPAYFPTLFIHRPSELVPGAFFCAALVLFLRKGHWRWDAFEHWLVISLVVSLVSQIVYMPFSRDLFDMPFDLAHLLKAGGYGCVLAGLVHDIYVSFRQAGAKNDELDAKVKERTLFLEATQRELERSNKELNEFAYVASHDLKAPLRDVDNLAGWIVEDVGESLPQDSRQHLQTLQSRTRRMEALLDDLLEYSRAGRVFAEPESFAPAALLRDVVALVNAGESFTIEVPSDVGTIRGPKAALALVFRNLISNAIKHHDRPDGQITVTAQDQPDSIRFTVKDDGPGIAAEYHERVFGMFQTLQPRDVTEGTGMGLALVKKLVEAHGGSIELESQPGQGCAFSFTWPKHWQPERRART